MKKELRRDDVSLAVCVTAAVPIKLGVVVDGFSADVGSVLDNEMVMAFGPAAFDKSATL